MTFNTFVDEVEVLYVDRTYICNLELHQKGGSLLQFFFVCVPVVISEAFVLSLFTPHLFLLVHREGYAS